MKPENIIEICVAIDIAILGIAYPIIIDKISHIGDKYASEYVSELFSSEFPERKIFKGIFRNTIFKWTLFATIFSFFFLIFRFEPLFGWDNWFINHSADLVVLILTTFLVILFFLWLGKVLLYDGKSKSLLIHLINKYNKAKPGTVPHEYCLKAINEMAYYAIDKKDIHLQETLLHFYRSVFHDLRKNHDRDTPLIYPVDLYFLVSRLNEIAVYHDNKS